MTSSNTATLATVLRKAAFAGTMVLTAALATPGGAAAAAPIEAGGMTSAGNFLAALIAGAKRDTTNAAIYWRQALKEDPRNRDILNRAFVMSLADGDLTEALPLAERIAARDPKNSNLAELLLGIRSLKNQQYATARANFARAGGRGGQTTDLTASLLTAWTHVGSGNLTKALEMSDRAVREPALASYRNFFGGLMAEVAGNAQEANRRLKAAYEAEPQVLRIVDAYARSEARSGRRDNALAILDKVEQQTPRQPLIAKTLEELKAGRIPAPLIATPAEGAAEIFYGLGTLGGRSGDETAALIYLQLSRYLDPKNEIVSLTLAEVFEQIEQYERAGQAYDRVPDASPLKSRALIRSAVAKEKLGKGEEGIASLRAYLLRQPDDADAVDMLAALLRSKKRWLESADAYSKVLELIPAPTRRHWNLFYGRGIAYERAKQWDKAEVDFKKALSLLPENPVEPLDRRDRAQVLNYLGYSWVDTGVHIEEAFPMLRKAVELAPNDGSIVDSLGWAHFRRGYYDDAVKELERAVELRPADSTINDHLGDAYWKAGRKLEATFQWNHARDLKPEPDDLPKILKKIEKGYQDESPDAQSGQPQKNGG